ncbi:glycogen synthase [Shewanella sp. AS16]|uniref:glycogen synthase n=1 Tax=Shewanella sp. AS16 TaxID=2907625 RepID=UPI001F2AFAC5|nr:glycogen/starch synthase [Shewanella sp. AS16]MCE9685201.1 glycogen synthase [Shewanella sp. AS16]
MLAAENAALEHAKVGGMADVIRDLPPALAEQGLLVDVVMPGYGFLPAMAGAELMAELSVAFGGRRERVEVYRAAHPLLEGAHIYLLEHGLFVTEHGGIYCDGSPDRPFAEDATKFALWCAAVAGALLDGLIPMPEVLHLHDWHAGLFAMLRAFAPEYRSLRAVPCVFTIHNLALQGIRPVRQEASSLAAWFPGLLQDLDSEQLAQILDPRYPQCVNPMRAGIVLSDRVHLVSPSYAREVLQASCSEKGFFGGEGLEADLRLKSQQGRLLGILNGCHYGGTAAATSRDLSLVLSAAEQALMLWQGPRQLTPALDTLALCRIAGLWRALDRGRAPDFLLTSVGRLTDQKVLILRQAWAEGQNLLQCLLTRLRALRPGALFIMLGSGDAAIAAEFRRQAAGFDNFLFLNGYDEALAEHLYRAGDLFLMPSSFEPCGISQMLAMRAGQVCLVHGVGGLKDTVTDGETGLVFNGRDLREQGQELLGKLEQALAGFGSPAWHRLAKAAAGQRFDWHAIAGIYRRELYRLAND